MDVIESYKPLVDEAKVTLCEDFLGLAQGSVLDQGYERECV